ncbi:hypothetical protein E2C01_088839 [Portunus trituberculatus]|uniref:Uncharacterized protein n=1 Tax=Portunus trituberculatus TaxID=210409 RepID=A0A5B7JFR1_PORTR|nr:hypothetical protein [Portunus trituberculatus]
METGPHEHKAQTLGSSCVSSNSLKPTVCRRASTSLDSSPEVGSLSSSRATSSHASREPSCPLTHIAAPSPPSPPAPPPLLGTGLRLSSEDEVDGGSSPMPSCYCLVILYTFRNSCGGLK